MQKVEKIRIFLVDDDALFLKSLEIEFSQIGVFEVITFSTGELCITNLSAQPDVVVLDYHLDGIDEGAMNGLEALDKIKQFNRNIPVIMLSSQDKIEVAIDCMHHQAIDYVVKSETAFMRIQKIIKNYFECKKLQNVISWYEERV